MKGRVSMKELTVQQQCEIQGGGLIATALGAAAYKIIKSKKGRISIPRLISIEWRD